MNVCCCLECSVLYKNGEESLAFSALLSKDVSAGLLLMSGKGIFYLGHAFPIC